MPPKPKKPKVKKDKSVKAIAKTKKGSAQAQTTNVIVKVGETKKPARRAKKGGAKGVPPPRPPPPDGWYPPSNLMRNGATFAGAEQIRYVNVPTPAQTSFIAGGAVAPPAFVPPPAPPAPMPEAEPDMESGYDAAFSPETDSGFNVTEFLRQAKQPKERMKYFYEGEDFLTNRSTQTSLVPPEPEPPSFTDTFSLEPPEPEPEPTPPPKRRPPPLIIEEDETEVPPVPSSKKETQRISLLNEVKGIIGQLEEEGIISKRGASKKKFLDEIFGEFGTYKGNVKDYSEFQLGVARENIRNIYGR